MLTTIEFIKKDGGVLTLPIYAPTNFAVMDVQGLDPVKANVVTSNFSQMDGTRYETSRREMRNLIFKIRMLSTPDASVQDLRKQLYSYLLPKTDVTIKFTQDHTNSFIINGHIESFEAPIFVKEPEAIISVLCFDPDFYSSQTLIASGTSVLSNSTNNLSLNYLGEIDTGFKFRLTANTTIENLTIRNTLYDGSVKEMFFANDPYLLISGDILEVNTTPGNKYVKRFYGGVGSGTSMLYTLSRTSDWLKLYPGYNYIKVVSSANNQPYTIEYTNKYGGL